MTARPAAPTSITAGLGDLAARVAQLEAQLAVDRVEHEQAREVLAQIIASNARVIAALIEFAESAEATEVAGVPAKTDPTPSASGPPCRPARWFLQKGGA